MVAGHSTLVSNLVELQQLTYSISRRLRALILSIQASFRSVMRSKQGHAIEHPAWSQPPHKMVMASPEGPAP